MIPDRPDRKAMMPTTPAQSGAATNGGGSGSSGSKAIHEHSSGPNSDRGNAAGKSSGGRSTGKGASRGASNSAATGSSSRASPASGAPSNQHTPSASSAKAKSTHTNTASGPASGVGPIPTTPLPLSSMVSPPLDLNSVERRGQPTASREPTRKKARPHDIEDAPTFCPTEEEWRDPMEYMRKITPEARKYGICKVIPPDSWNPSFAIDTQRFHFQTRKQELNSVEGSTRVNLSYLEGLFKYHKNLGNNLTRLPFVDKKPLDLYQLKKAVDSRGGFDMVCKLKKWAEIGRDLGYSGKIMSSLSTSLKNSYQKWLCPYEDFLRLAKPGVHQQLELENGGPFTPSPGASPMKRSTVNTPSSLRGDSPARVATDALQASICSSAASGDRDTPGTLSGTPPPTSHSNRFTSTNGRPSQRDDSSGMLGSRNSSPLTPANGPSESRLGPAHPLKRQLDIDALMVSDKDEPVDDDDSGNSRRSKRLKKVETIPRVAGSYMSLLRPPQPRVPRDDKGDSKESCEQCGGGEEAGFLAICETCEHAYHGTCLDPPITSRPDLDWNCPRCLVGDGQFGFEDGGLYSLKQFQEKAAEFKQSHFEKKMPFDPVHNCYRPVTEDDVEREFWRLVSSIDETVEVEYGADIHCTTHGSGFPTVEKNPDDPYATDPWNLNILPLHPESLFRYIKSDISGMTVPWVYVGMIFSTFCWHNEDHYAYSANYQHFGATKTWYGIPGEDAEKFENAMREAVPDLFETQPDLLFQLVTLLPPDKLKKAGVRVYALDQRAGQFVITFPQAYHAGFNHGFNFNEAVNFAPCDWEPFGLAGVERLQQFRRQPCFSHDELLWTAAEGITHTATGGLTIQTAKWLAPALERMQKRESALRAAFLAKHAELSYGCPLGDKMAIEDTKPKSSLEVELNDKDVPEEEYQCFHCKIFTYLSRFRCSKTGKTFCLEHGSLFQCCQMRENHDALDEGHSLVYRKSAEEMDAVMKKVSEKARLPEAWEEKYEKVLDEGATPSLKSLRALFNEGEKIPYELPSLPLLREFVERCNHWVEEATTYIVRKQQNRRRTDKNWQSGARKSIGGPADVEDNKGREARSISNIARLLAEAHQIGFDCPEIVLLQQRANAIKIFQEQAKYALDHDTKQTIDTIEKYLDEGQNFNVDLPEVDRLTRLLDQLKWSAKAEASRNERLTLEKISDLLEEGQRLEIPAYNDNMAYINKLSISGRQWETTAKELLNAEAVHYPQLEALCSQATGGLLPVSEATLQSIEQMLHKHRDAHRQIMDMTRRCRDPDFRNRPRYSEVAELMKKIDELQSKPVGTLDLEREHKRNDDWIRKGKKIFGKTNAPLYIFKSHLEYVLDRNTDCFDIIHDKPRSPAEPASREVTPDVSSPSYKASKSREVFCICRRVEAGMMIECEVCREWYHGRCLKIARGKVKDDDKYTCPICDWRVKIPRDAARPDLDSLIALYNEITSLPFQPEEEQILNDIIQNAMDFREAIAVYIDPSLTSTSDAIKQRFYLRKIEGAEVLLTRETNFFRKILHEKFPIAPSPPEPIEESKSTRKPRPTKLQKMMAQYQVDDPEDLPENVKLRANSLRRKLPSTGLAGDGVPGSYKPLGMTDYSSPTGLTNRQLDSGLSMPTLHPHKAATAPSTQSRPAFLDSLSLSRSENASYSGGQRLGRSPDYHDAMRSGDGAHDGYERSNTLEIEKNTHANLHRNMTETDQMEPDQEEQEWPKDAAAPGENNRATVREMGNESRLFPALGTAKAA